MSPSICKVCKTEFVKQKMGQKVCGPECAITLAAADRVKKTQAKDRTETRKAKAKLKSRRDWLREVQTVVNAYVRERDKEKPCISCGRHHQGQYHAGHYLSVGAHPELRFDENNIHKQCQPCNTHLSGNQLEYRKGLIARYSQDYVSAIETPAPTRKYQVSELIELKAFYKEKLKSLRASQ